MNDSKRDNINKIITDEIFSTSLIEMLEISIIAMLEISIVAIIGSVEMVVAMPILIIAIIIATIIEIMIIIIVISFDVETIKGLTNTTRKKSMISLRFVRVRVKI